MLEANYFSTPLPPPGHCLKVRSLLSSQYRFISTIVFGKIMKYSYKQVNVLKEMFYSRKWVYHLISVNYEAGLTFCRIVSQVAVEQRKRRKNSGWRSDISFKLALPVSTVPLPVYTHCQGNYRRQKY